MSHGELSKLISAALARGHEGDPDHPFGKMCSILEQLALDEDAPEYKEKATEMCQHLKSEWTKQKQRGRGAR